MQNDTTGEKILIEIVDLLKTSIFNPMDMKFRL